MTTAVYKLMLTQQAPRTRLILLTGAGILSVFVALALRNSGQSNLNQVGALFIAVYGLEIFVPVTALLLSTATLGDMYDDGTLVYLWLRPIGRWRLAAAAVMSSLTIALPICVVPLAVASIASGASTELTSAVLITAPLGLLAYCTIFTALGMRSRRSLIWGLIYIFIWEGFIARAGGALAYLAVRCYTESVLVSITGARLDQAGIDPPWSWSVPLVVSVLALAYTVRRLRRQDIP